MADRGGRSGLSPPAEQSPIRSKRLRSTDRVDSRIEYQRIEYRSFSARANEIRSCRSKLRSVYSAIGERRTAGTDNVGRLTTLTRRGDLQAILNLVNTRFQKSHLLGNTSPLLALDGPL